jgi:hypothetical protein
MQGYVTAPALITEVTYDAERAAQTIATPESVHRISLYYPEGY